jgi:hypothetical protein
MELAMKFLIPLCLTLAALPGTSLAQTIQLRNGEILVGDVQIKDGGNTILVHVRYPKVRDVVLARKDLTPKSLYAIFEKHADRKNADTLWAIAMLAKDARMYGVAISDLVAVKTLDPKKKGAVAAAITDIHELIAGELLQDARDALAMENPRAALVYLHTIKERYPDTKAANETKTIMSLAHSRAGARVDIAHKTVSAEMATKVLAKISEFRERGDKSLRMVRGKNRRTVGGSRLRRALDKAINYYRKAWQAARKLPVAVAESKLRERIGVARSTSRKLLVGALIDAATLQLVRTSVTKAEEFCKEACALDPENKKLRDVHKTIIEAKAHGY